MAIVKRAAETLAKLTLRYEPGKTNWFISVYPHPTGGGPNSFSANFHDWIQNHQESNNLVGDLPKADMAIIIADKGSLIELEKARDRGCFVIHRLDEHVEEGESVSRQKKHQQIKNINQFADVTVYQSEFVFENLHPYLNHPEPYAIIYNGAHQEDFFSASVPGEKIGHVTWGVGDKKRLDLLFQEIQANPDEEFLLVGNHFRSNYEFNKQPNVELAGAVNRDELLPQLHRMKYLFFPSENDPCPNTVVEAILAGVPVCYNPRGGTVELVKDCGVPLSEHDRMKEEWPILREKCLQRSDLNFADVAEKYAALKNNY